MNKLSALSVSIANATLRASERSDRNRDFGMNLVILACASAFILGLLAGQWLAGQ